MAETFRLSEEVTRMIADSIVQKEVIEPMEKIGWREAAAPPAPDYSGQPATTPEGAQAPTPAITTGQPGQTVPALGEQTTTPEAITALLASVYDPATKKFAGKYDTPEQFVKG